MLTGLEKYLNKIIALKMNKYSKDTFPGTSDSFRHAKYYGNVCNKTQETVQTKHRYYLNYVGTGPKMQPVQNYLNKPEPIPAEERYLPSDYIT
jgi:hypothetical protein